MNLHFEGPAIAGLDPSQDPIRADFSRTETRMREAHATHLGYPYNLSFPTGVPVSLSHYLINNLGDPYTGSHYASEVCRHEREAIAFLMELWECPDSMDYWGSIGASGTEGNFWGIYLGREALPDSVLLHGADAHYSLPKAARIQRVPAVEVASTTAGEIDLGALADALRGLKGRPVILALTCGTTMKGAHDDIAGAIRVLDDHGYGPDRRYIHVDGALNAMVVPFLPAADRAIRPSFAHAIDSISTSGHKMIGTPMPCGAIVCRREHVARIARNIAYLRSDDTTMMGSRNGHAVLAIWARFRLHGREGYARDALKCTEMAQVLAARLRSAAKGRDGEVLCNLHSMTVVFRQPSEWIVKRYQLACAKGLAHAIVMPNVTEKLLDRFVADWARWIETEQ